MRKSFLPLIGIPALSLLTAAPALAQAPGDAEIPAVAEVSADRTFSTLDRVGNRTSVGVDLLLHSFEGPVQVDTTRIDLHARYVHPSGAGIGIALPLTIFNEGDTDDEDDEGTPLRGNLSIDGFYRLQQGDLKLFLRAGAVLPTGSHDSGQVAIFGSLGRITDIPTDFDAATVLRLGVSPQYDHGRIFLRGDLGLDLILDQPSGSDGGPWAHLNVAAGYDTGPVDIAAEIANQHYFAKEDDDGLGLLNFDQESNTITNIALSARYTAAVVEPHIALVLPTNDNILELGVMIGAEGKLPL
jgi:hypothetical protein